MTNHELDTLVTLKYGPFDIGSAKYLRSLPESVFIEWADDLVCRPLEQFNTIAEFFAMNTSSQFCGYYKNRLRLLLTAYYLKHEQS